MQHRQLIDFAIDFYSFAINTVGLIINFSSRGFSVMKSLFHADQDRLYELELTLAALEREQIRTIDACEFGIIVFDGKGQCVSINSRWKEIFQMTMRHMQGFNILTNTNARKLRNYSIIKKSFEGEPGRLNDTLVKPEELNLPGRERWTCGNALPLFKGNNRSGSTQIGSALIVQDVTEAKILESELRRISEVLSNLETAHAQLTEHLASLHTHDRRSPLVRPKSMPTADFLRNAAPLVPRREREVFESLANGVSVKETAHMLDLGIKSVYTYRARLLNRLKLNSDVELAIAWREINEDTGD